MDLNSIALIQYLVHSTLIIIAFAILLGYVSIAHLEPDIWQIT